MISKLRVLNVPDENVRFGSTTDSTDSPAIGPLLGVKQTQSARKRTWARMSLVGGRPDVARRWSELLLLAKTGLSPFVDSKSNVAHRDASVGAAHSTNCGYLAHMIPLGLLGGLDSVRLDDSIGKPFKSFEILTWLRNRRKDGLRQFSSLM